MSETLIIKDLGPIKGEVTIKPGRLTVIIGEQASGKSLVAQLLYFFRGLESHLARYYKDRGLRKRGWQDRVVTELLDDFRGVPFSTYLYETSQIHYQNDTQSINYLLLVKNGKIRCNEDFKNVISTLFSSWDEDKEKLTKSRSFIDLFIPTDRSQFTTYYLNEQSVLFAGYQTYLFKQFCNFLLNITDVMHNLLQSEKKSSKKNKVGDKIKIDDRFFFLVMSCHSALKGFPTVSKEDRIWTWLSNETGEVWPIGSISSGQMEAWPFYAIANIFIMTKKTSYVLYFEEPETHLHPQAQWEIVKTISFLVNLGVDLTITTHSPYVLYAFNNMIQRYLAWGKPGSMRSHEFRQKPWLDPGDLSAYRLGSVAKDIMDSETQLIDAEELEAVADQMGEEFHRLLEGKD